MVDGDGQIIAHPDPKRINEDVSWYPAVQLARQSGQVGAVTALNARKESRLFAYRRIGNPGTLARQPWVLLTEIDADEQLAPLLRLRRELVLGIALVLLGGLIVAHQVSRSIQQPLQTLGDFAHRIGTGDLTGRVALSGRDVAGRLAGALNEMAAGLEERDHVKEVFGRYIATQVSDKILSGQVNLGGESRHVTILFSDIRNFTTMAEQLTPAQVVSFLNEYFSEMVDAVFEQNGMLDKFLGDGLMAVFGAFGDASDHPRRAVLAALRMKALLAKINGERAMAGKPPIAIGIGIHSDEVIVGNIGSRKRLEYTVVGDGVNVSSRLQTLNKEFGTTILISETTFRTLHDEFECRLMPEASLRGKTKELRFYEVVSVKATANA
jgi:adenylate cyclase